MDRCYQYVLDSEWTKSVAVFSVPWSVYPADTNLRLFYDQTNFSQLGTSFRSDVKDLDMYSSKSS